MSIKKADYKERFTLFIDGIQKELPRIERFLHKAFKEKNYKDCLEYKEMLSCLSWVLEYAEHVFETGKEL